MIATLRRLLLVSAGAIALSASGLAQVSADLQKTLSQAYAANERSDYVEAVRWYRLAADQGLADAQHNLGVIYANGQGVPQNDIEAVRWFRLAADQGYAPAQAELGFMYMTGRGVQPSDVEAVRWYRLATEQGNATAQTALANMYAIGQGVQQNDVEAYKLYSLAAAQGDNDASSLRDIIRSGMTPAQIAEASSPPAPQAQAPQAAAPQAQAPQAQTPLSPRQFDTVYGAPIEDAIASDILAACAGELAAWRADEAAVTMDLAGRPTDNSGRVQDSLEHYPPWRVSSDPSELDARAARDEQYLQSHPWRSSGDAQHDTVTKASNTQGWFNVCAWKRRAAQLRGTALPLDKPAVADAGPGPLNLRDLPVTATAGKSPAVPKTQPSPPTITIMTNSGTACFSLTMTRLELINQDTQWSFQYNLKNTCSTPQLFIAEEKQAGGGPVRPGIFDLSVMNPGTWYEWSHPGTPPGLAFPPSDPRGSGGPPVEHNGILSGGSVFRSVEETSPIYIWLASCDAYSRDGTAMTLFRAASYLVEDSRVQCIPNLKNVR